MILKKIFFAVKEQKKEIFLFIKLFKKGLLKISTIFLKVSKYFKKFKVK